MVGLAKTTALEAIREGAERNGYAVEGFAPTSRAAAQLREASRQTHLHRVILDENHEVFDVGEFKNVYDLGALLSAAREIGVHLERYNFDKAKQAFFHEFSMEGLMAL